MDDARELEQIGPYKVKRFVDEGAFAWVFEVTDPKFAARRLALKMLKPEAAAGDEFRRFEDEASLLAQINHPHVVTIFDFGRDDATGCFYYTMTFIDGPTLKGRLADGTGIPRQEALRIFVDILDGLDKIHRREIVHRDIKPGNILIDGDGRAYLGDLGIARVQTERSKTRTGVAVGTALYMSPEQARGRPVDHRSDLFSVGLTLYEVLTGEVVYEHVESVDSTSGMDVLMYIGGLVHQKREFEVIFPKTPEVPKRLREIIQKACRLSADDRYQSAAEMRQELFDLLHAPPPEPTLTAFARRYRWAIAAAAGLLVALVVGLAVYGRIQAGEQERRAALLFGQAAELDEAVDGIVDRATDLGAPPELLSRVGAVLAEADGETVDGEQDRLDGYHGYAIKRFDTAISAYGQACDMLAAGFLDGRADEAAADAHAQAARLREAGAPEHAGEAWAALELALPSMAAVGGAGCEGAQNGIARLDAAAAVGLALARVNEDLAAAWPRLADEARQRAVTERRRAEVDGVEAREYTKALREGKILLLRGEASQTRGEFEEARGEFDEASARFEEALRIAPAARGRQESHALALDVQGQGVALGGVTRILSEADRLYADAEWDQAATAYGDALTRLRGMRAEHEMQAAVAQAREQALGARERAAAEGSEASAPSEWQAAEEALAGARGHVEQGGLAPAEEAFRAARDRFQAAQEAAIGAQQAAAAAGIEADAEARQLLGEAGSCASLAAEDAQQSCAAGVAAQQAGAAALEARDAARAAEQFAAASAAFRSALEHVERWESTRPRPPVLVRRQPERPLVEGVRNEVRSFQVEAEDPNGDRLAYEWTVNGERQKERSNVFQLRLERDARVEVRVDDGQGGELLQSWSVEVGNQPPRLAVTPAEDDLTVNVGDSLLFRSVATDADGEEVATFFRINGEEMAGGSSYLFVAERPGTYKLEIVARDQSKAESREVRLIRVPSPGGPDPAGADLDWRRAVQHALDEYEQALEQGDIGRLEQVLLMQPDSAVRAFYERKFSRGERVDVRIDVKGPIRGDSRLATVDFDQTEMSPSRTRTYRYRATMATRPDGQWRIERRERRP